MNTKKITFEEAYFKYLEYVKLKQKKQSINDLKEKFNYKIIPFFKDYNLDEINENLYIEFQQSLLNENYKYNTLRNYHFLCSSFFNYCCNFLNLNKNVAKIVGNFKNINNETPKSDYYTIKEFKKFIKQVDEYVYKEFFKLMFFTGTRPGEAMALTFNDLLDKKININKTMSEHGNREIGSTKTLSSNRIIGIDYKTYKNLLKLKKYYMKQYSNYNDNFYIFGGIKPLSPTSIRRRIKKASDKANVKYIKIHDFRHSHATLLNDKNINVKTISQRLGHSDIRTTLNTYIHETNKQEKRVLNTLRHIRLN